jgi:hypothetical protein
VTDIIPSVDTQKTAHMGPFLGQHFPGWTLEACSLALDIPASSEQ